jgi:hypothetical protein
LPRCDHENIQKINGNIISFFHFSLLLTGVSLDESAEKEAATITPNVPLAP